VPRRVEYVPKHRGSAAEPALKKGIKKSVLFSGVAVAATGLAVSSGIFAQDDAIGDSASASLSARDFADTPMEDLAERQPATSRGDRRTSLSDAKKHTLGQDDSGGQRTKTQDLTSADPRDIARAMLPEFGFSASEFSCLDALYVSESGWNPHADNPSSSAYGIPQALPGSKMASAGPDWETNPVTQIRWGLGYIQDRYGSPCSAWSFKQGNNWY
jgi:hypothetical protein